MKSLVWRGPRLAGLWLVAVVWFSVGGLMRFSPGLDERGIMVTGGGALLRDIDRLLMEETGLTVLIADDPLTCVVRGCGMALERMDKLGSIFEPFRSEGHPPEELWVDIDILRRDYPRAIDYSLQAVAGFAAGGVDIHHLFSLLAARAAGQ